jgi:hypothetical protein
LFATVTIWILMDQNISDAYIEHPSCASYSPRKKKHHVPQLFLLRMCIFMYYSAVPLRP